MSSAFFRCKDHTVSCQHIRGYYRATAFSQDTELRLAVKQYIPLDNLEPRTGDVTIIAAHAAGSCKELYEPFFDELYLAAKNSNEGVRIRSIWIADTATHGASSVLNEGKLGIDLCWEDHARDLLHLINHFREEMSRPLVGIGNSMGGAQIVQLALLHPRLFSTLICIEPIINKRLRGFNFAPTYWLSKRNDVWASREDAVAESQNNVIQKSWDGRVRDLWNKHGFRELPTLLYPHAPEAVASNAVRKGNAPVTLTTTKHHEVRAYARDAFPAPGQPLNAFQPPRETHIDLTKAQHDDMAMPFYLAAPILIFQQLPFLRPSCFYIYGASSPFTSSKSQARAEKLSTTGIAVGGSGGLKAGKVKEVVLEGVGHLIPFEKPALVAEQVVNWLGIALADWKRDDRWEKEAWDKVGVREKAVLDQHFMFWMEKQYGKKGVRSRSPNDQKSINARL